MERLDCGETAVNDRIVHKWVRHSMNGQMLTTNHEVGLLVSIMTWSREWIRK